jgi:hypothetical protein
MLFYFLTIEHMQLHQRLSEVIPVMQNSSRVCDAAHAIGTNMFIVGQ